MTVVLPEVLTEEEAAKALKLCARSLRKERQAGRLTYRLFGGAIRYTMDDLRDYIEGARQCPSIKEKAPRSGGSTSRSTVSDFEEALAKKRNGKPAR